MILFKINFIIIALYGVFYLGLYMYAKIFPWEYTLKHMDPKVHWWELVAVIGMIVSVLATIYNLIYFLFFIL